MPFVIDASVTACWVLPNEQNAIADEARRRIENDIAWAPALWWFEFRNMLIVNERRGRITPADTQKALALLAVLAVRLDQSPDEQALLSLARRYRLSVYDAAYLEMAMRENMPLATLDLALTTAARAEQVALMS